MANSLVGMMDVIDMRSSQTPQSNLPTIIRAVYTIPFHTMEPSNISVIGMENPTDAFPELDVRFLPRREITYKEEWFQDPLERLRIISCKYGASR